MFTEADLHTDRLSANEERAIAWRYRNVEFCPAEVMPGFAMHQTDRDPTKLEHDPRSNNHSRARDFDLLGYRYSLMSSIGTGGLNNVINMLPARDEQEYSLLPKEDIAFVNDWMKWTDDHVEWLQQTKSITGLPSGGMLDATAMIVKNRGAMFVFNPTSSAATLSVVLDHTLGFTSACEGTLSVAVTGSSNRGFTPYNLAAMKCGAQLRVSVPPTTALSFEFNPASDAGFTVFGGAATVVEGGDR